MFVQFELENLAGTTIWIKLEAIISVGSYAKNTTCIGMSDGKGHIIKGAPGEVLELLEKMEENTNG